MQSYSALLRSHPVDKRIIVGCKTQYQIRLINAVLCVYHGRAAHSFIQLLIDQSLIHFVYIHTPSSMTPIRGPVTVQPLQ